MTEEQKVSVPEDLSYTADHEWARVENATARVGITAFAAASLGDVVHVELPSLGTTVRAGEACGEVESTKSVSDLYAPVSGTVTAINEELANTPEKINTDAHAAWILKLELSDPSEVDSLLDAAAYETFVKEETGH